MEDIKRLLVGLNLSKQDEITIAYSALISRLAEVEIIYFLHVFQTYFVFMLTTCRGGMNAREKAMMSLLKL